MVPTLTMLGRFSECTRDVMAVPEVPTALVTGASMTLCSCPTPPGGAISHIDVLPAAVARGFQPVTLRCGVGAVIPRGFLLVPASLMQPGPKAWMCLCRR